MIYAVHILNQKFVKIGFSDQSDIALRIAQLQTGNPYQILPLFEIDGGLIQEKAIHYALARGFTRVRIPMPPNEWYPGRNPFFQKFLDELKFGTASAILYLEKYDSSVKQPSAKHGQALPNIKWPSEDKIKNRNFLNHSPKKQKYL